MKLLTEFVGTFLFLLVISLAAPSGSPLTPLAIGGALMVMVYMGGHRSGGHYNPAVSFGFLLQGKLTILEFLGYVVAQIVGGLAAFAVGFALCLKTVGFPEDFDPNRAVVVEALFTLALVLVVMNVAASKKTEGNSFYGLAIGFTIVVAAVAGGPISGGAFNPAVGIGAAVINASQGHAGIGNIWVPIVGPLLGGALGSMIWKFQETSDHPPVDHPVGVPVESVPAK